jgi:hypothetical protein
VYHRRCTSTNLEARLKNPNATYFQVKQAVKSQRVSYTVLSVSFMAQPTNQSLLDFEPETKKSPR